MKLLFRCKLALYPTKSKTESYTKIISLFKYFVSYKFKCYPKTPVFSKN